MCRKKNSQGQDPRTREENSQAWDPRTRERKNIANCRQVDKFASRSAVVRLCEHWGRMRLRIRCELSNVNVFVGESGDRSVRAEKASQQAERRIQSHRKSRKSGRREENLQMMTRSSVHCRKQSTSSGKGPSRRWSMSRTGRAEHPDDDREDREDC